MAPATEGMAKEVKEVMQGKNLGQCLVHKKSKSNISGCLNTYCSAMKPTVLWPEMSVAL